MLTTSSDNDIKRIILALLHNQHLEYEDIVCERIGHGGNNRTFKVRCKKNIYLLKEYFTHPDDPRNRLGAEYGFLEFCQRVSIENVPKPIAKHSLNNMALYSWINGTIINSSNITLDHVQAAADFYALLVAVSHTKEARVLPFAADACTQLHDHYTLVEQKLQRLHQCLQDKDANALEKDVLSLVKNKLFPAFDFYKTQAQKYILASECAPYPEDYFILSPSDFGFHNALLSQDGLFFIDFEYAGKDDPIKTLCDFVCQPAYRVPKGSMDILRKALYTHHADAHTISLRAERLLPLHYIKWCCIILNHFVRVDAQRRTFAQGQNILEQQQTQYALAVDYYTHFLEIMEI